MGYFTESGYLSVRVGTNFGRFGTRLLLYHLSRLETLRRYAMTLINHVANDIANDVAHFPDK